MRLKAFLTLFPHSWPLSNITIATKFDKLQEMHEYLTNQPQQVPLNQVAAKKTSQKNNKCSMYPISKRNSGVSCNMTRMNDN